MAPKSKRQVTSRAQARKPPAAATILNGREESNADFCPSVPRKRKAGDPPSDAGRSAHIATQPSSARVPVVPPASQPRSHPRVNVATTVREVLPPPPSRTSGRIRRSGSRPQGSSSTPGVGRPPGSSEENRSPLPRSPEQVNQHENRVSRTFRTAETIPEETCGDSDDCDCFEISREPFHQNPSYQRFMGTETRGGGGPTSGVALVSPVTPGPMHTDLHGFNNHDFLNHDGIGTGEPSPRGQPDSRAHEEFNLVNCTREMLNTFYKDLEQLLTKETALLRQFLSHRLDTLARGQNNMSEQIQQLRVVVPGGRSASTNQSRTTPLSKYEGKLDARTPHAEWVFNVESISRPLRVNLPHTMVSIAGERGNPVDNISVAMRAILFGLLPSQKRAAFSSGVGRRHSEFRFNVVKNLLYKVQPNRFGRVSAPVNEDAAAPAGPPDNGVVDAAGPVPAGGNPVLQIVQPDWLKPGFVRQKHVKEARRRLECNAPRLETAGQQNSSNSRQRRSWITVKETPDNADLARYGSLKVHRFVTTGLYYSREKAKWVLFEELLYVMVPWGDVEGDVDQRFLRVAWGHEGADVEEIEMSVVPLCRKVSVDPIHADEHNRNVFAEFLSARKEMVLCASHGVKIRPVDCSSRNRRTEGRIIQRSINLIDVAARFCVVFTEQAMGGFSTEAFLGAHTDSLRCIYCVASILRRMVKTFIHEHVVNGAFVRFEEEDPPQIQCHGISLDNLLPAASVQKRLLNSRCLRMTIEEYNKMNVTWGNGGSSDDENTEEDPEIHPDAKDGVIVM